VIIWKNGKSRSKGRVKKSTLEMYFFLCGTATKVAGNEARNIAAKKQ
jgi:hypothetical protein